MGHAILGQRFYSLNEVAWHTLGHVKNIALSANEAVDLVGDYTTTLQPVNILLPDGKQIASDYKAIVRHPVPEDNCFRTFGVVKDWKMISLREAAQTWDKYVGAKLETLGILFKGARFFMSTKLPIFTVAGTDVIVPYLTLDCPVDGMNAVEIRRSEVRPVCWNTLLRNKEESLETISLRHTDNVLQMLGEFAGNMYQNALETMQQLSNSYNRLAEVTTTDETAVQTIETVYDIPDEPAWFKEMPEAYYKHKAEQWKQVEQRMLRRRAMSEYLWHGPVAGGNEPGMTYHNGTGTLWRLYNAINQTENWRRGRGDYSRAYDVLYGNRANTIQRAYYYVSQLVEK